MLVQTSSPVPRGPIDAARWRSFPVRLLLLGALASTLLTACPERMRPERACPVPDAGPDVPEPDVGPPPCVQPPFDGRPVVYAHGPARPMDDTMPLQEFLAVIDTEARAIVEYIPIVCPEYNGSYLDLAVDGDGRVMLSGGPGFVRFDPVTRTCTTVRGPVVHNPGTDLEFTEYPPSPNNLTYVPRGVLDPTRELLAGVSYHFHDQTRQLYEGGFFRFDATSLEEEIVYEWPDELALSVSGDLVVVTNHCTGEPRAFMTMIGRRELTHCHSCAAGDTPGVDCGDCLYEIDVRHGTLAREVALLPASGVFGLALFGDALFGFSVGNFFEYESGRIFTITEAGGTTDITEIPVTPPDGYRSMHFNGAGSTSLAPILF